jgi:hypothetical protein
MRNLIGSRFGKLVAQHDLGSKGKRRMWRCFCDCGNTATVSSNALLRGNTKSCGCSRRESKRRGLWQSHCHRGHEMTGENVYVAPNGGRACARCRKEYRLKPESVKKMFEYRKFWQIQKLYGLTREQYEAKLVSQKNCCAICQREMTKPHLDHDHETKQLRDALCNNCNAAVGYVKENILIAESLVAYLRKWKSCLP